MQNIRHAKSMSESFAKLEEVKEECEHIDEETSKILEEINENPDQIAQIPTELHEKLPRNTSVPSIITKDLKKTAEDLNFEVSTTQNFMEKLSKIYNEKIQVNTINFYFICLILGVFNALTLLLGFTSDFPSENTRKLVSFKTKVSFSLTLLVFVCFKAMPRRYRDKHFIAVMIILFNFATFLTNSLVIHYFFFGNCEFSEVPHALLFEKDMRVLNLTIILLYFRYEVKSTLVFVNFVVFSMFVSVYSLVFLRLGLWKSIGDFLVFFFTVALIMLFAGIASWKNYFIKEEKKKKRETIEEEARKIKDELESVKTKLEKTFKTVSRPETASKGDELLMKLKYLKFQALVNLKNKMSPSPQSGKRKIKRGSNFVITDSCGSFSPSKMASAGNVGDNQQTILLQKLEAYDLSGGSAEKTKTDKKWTLTPEDVDEIMQGMISKPNMFWMPTIFYERKGSKGFKINKEAKDFLSSHFTDKPISRDGENPSFSNLKLEFDLDYIDFNPLNEYLSNVCKNWDYDIFLLQDLTHGNVVIEFGYSIFKYFKIDKVFKITEKSVITKFLSNVQNMYRMNPYHNAMHAADVANSVGFFLVNGFTTIFNQMECSSLVISALAHDLGHPGLNNAFLVASKSRYAIIYNDQSVLENFHASSLFQILLNENSDITKNLSEKEWRQFRKCSVQMILDTDLQKHFIIMNKFKSILALGEVNLNEESNRLLCLSTALKCADIGHGAKGLELHKKWSRRIIEEFFQQGDMEQRSGFPITPLCDRSGNISKSQEGFLKCIVLPLFETFNEFMKKPEIKEACLDQINKNLLYWEEQKKKEEVEKVCPFLEETKDVYEEIKSSSNNVSDNLSAFSV